MKNDRACRERAKGTQGVRSYPSSQKRHQSLPYSRRCASRWSTSARARSQRAASCAASSARRASASRRAAPNPPTTGTRFAFRDRLVSMAVFQHIPDSERSIVQKMKHRCLRPAFQNSFGHTKPETRQRPLSNTNGMTNQRPVWVRRRAAPSSSAAARADLAASDSSAESRAPTAYSSRSAYHSPSLSLLTRRTSRAESRNAVVFPKECAGVTRRDLVAPRALALGAGLLRMKTI